MTANSDRLATQKGPQFVYFVRTFRQFTGHLNPYTTGSLWCHDGLVLLFIIYPSRKYCMHNLHFGVLQVHFSIGHSVLVHMVFLIMP